MKTQTIAALKSKFDPAPEVRALRAQVAHLTSKIKELKLDEGEASEFVESVAAAVRALPVTAVRPDIRLPARAKVTKPVSEVWHFTDWHIGDVVDESELEGSNAFDYAIANKRVDTFLRKALDWTRVLRAAYTVDELVVICTADFVSGDIHEELKINNEWPLPVQVAKAAALLSRALLEASAHFPRVRVEFIIPDNHSRLTKKPQAKQQGLNSVNYLVGYIAQLQLAAKKNIEFNMYHGVQQVVDVRGYRYLCRHGHGIKGTWGIPYYGIDRVTAQQSKVRLNQVEGKRFNRLLIGHFHAPFYGQYWQVGGSLVGTSEYDHAENRFAAPCQTAWIVHPDHGPQDYNEFWL